MNWDGTTVLLASSSILGMVALVLSGVYRSRLDDPKQRSAVAFSALAVPAGLVWSMDATYLYAVRRHSTPVPDMGLLLYPLIVAGAVAFYVSHGLHEFRADFSGATLVRATSFLAWCSGLFVATVFSILV